MTAPTTTPPALSTNQPAANTNTPPVVLTPVIVAGGTNSPEGVWTAGRGAIYNQFDATGTNYVTQLVKRTAVGNTGWAVASDNRVNLFFQKNHILDATAQQQVAGCYNELANYGITNFDLVLLGSRFNPTNQLTFNGRSIFTTNLQWLDSGAFFTNALLAVSNLPDCRTSTVYVAWHYLPNNPVASDQWLAGVESSTTGAAAFQR